MRRCMSRIMSTIILVQLDCWTNRRSTQKIEPQHQKKGRAHDSGILSPRTTVPTSASATSLALHPFIPLYLTSSQRSNTTKISHGPQIKFVPKLKDKSKYCKFLKHHDKNIDEYKKLQGFNGSYVNWDKCQGTSNSKIDPNPEVKSAQASMIKIIIGWNIFNESLNHHVDLFRVDAQYHKEVDEAFWS